MKDAKFYISSAIFIILTAVKLLSPQAAATISDYINETLKLEEEQTQTIIALGTSLSKEIIMEVFDFSDNGRAEKSPAITPAPTPTPTQKPKPTPTAKASPKPAPTPTPTPEPEPTTPPAVAAFIKSQEEYSDYKTPDDVTYDVPKLPFEYTSPVEGHTSSGFGYRVHPLKNEVKYHYGTDFAVNTGTEVHAFADGKVYACGENDSFGKYVIVDHADGYRTLYAHCSELLKGSGNVKKGDVLALSGATGAVTGAHLHFELMHSGTYLNPEFYI